MRVTQIERDTDGAAAWISASVEWEDCDRPPTTLYFATDKAYESRLSLRGEPFLLACIMPALKNGERRLAIEANACPQFVDGLRTNLDIFARWYGASWQDIDLELKPNGSLLTEPGPRAAMLLSGGIDSLATLRRNMIEVPSGHPAKIRDCILIDYYGYLRDRPSPSYTTFKAENLGLFDEHLARLRGVAGEAEAEMLAVHTNVVSLDDDPAFWLDQFHGAAMAAVSHALSRNMGMMTFASADIPLMRPYGSHPLTDPNWSNAALRIHHDTMRFSRLEKTRMVAEWETGRRHLRVCTSLTSEDLNCGTCEKCLRTMLSLLVLGRLEGAPFPQHDLSAADVAGVHIGQPYQARQYREIIAGLTDLGRDDLVQPLARELARYDRIEAVKAFDERYFSGWVRRSYRRLGRR